MFRTLHSILATSSPSATTEEPQKKTMNSPYVYAYAQHIPKLNHAAINMAVLQKNSQTLETPLSITDSALSELITQQNSLIQQLKNLPYPPTFDCLLSQLAHLSSNSLAPEKAMPYTARVNKLLQAMLNDPAFYTYCIEVSIKYEEQNKTHPDPLCIFSQAIKVLISLENRLNSESLPPHASYLELIAWSKKILIWEGLIRYLQVGESVLKLKEGMSKGLRQQLEISMIYQAQAHLDLPITVAPLDEVVKVSEHILQEALIAAKVDIKEPVKFYAKLWTLLFWHKYILKGYKQDAAVKGTPLEKACKYIGRALKMNAAQGKWCERYPDDLPEKARRKTIYLVFIKAIEETLAAKGMA
jgi:hypothetical protein